MATVFRAGGVGGVVPALSNRLEEMVERPVQAENFTRIVSTAEELRDRLAASSIEIDRSEKIRLLKLLNRAKVRVLLRGGSDGEDAFHALDLIESDMLEGF